MEVKVIGGQLAVKHRLKSSETWKISKGRKSQTISIFKKPQILKGIASSTEDGYSVLFIDYDNIYKDLVLEDYRILQEEFYIPQAYLFTTKQEKDVGGLNGNYHVICLAKMNYNDIHKVLTRTRCDSAYTSMPLRNRYRNWILRISTKEYKKRPKFIGIIGNEIFNGNLVCSSPHKKFLQKAYKNIKHPEYKNFDDCKKVFLQEYEAF